MGVGLDLAVGALSVFMGFFYYRVGRIVWARRPDGDANLAATAFAIWWFTLAVVQAGAVANLLIKYTWQWSLASYMTYLVFLVILIVAALAALTYYFVYLFTGRRQMLPIIVGSYVVYLGLLLYFIFAQQPVAVVESEIGTELRYGNDLSGTALATAIGILLLAPPLIGAMAYFSLFFRAPEPSQRFRIAAIAGAFIAWFGSSLIAGRIGDFAETTTWRLMAPFIALTATYMVYIAFRPPAWIRKRFGLVGFGEAPS